MGQLWAAFSPLSGETTLLNDEGAAILEILRSGWMTQEHLCVLLADDTGQAVAEITPIVQACWPRLLEAGLVQRIDTHPEAAASAP